MTICHTQKVYHLVLRFSKKKPDTNFNFLIPCGRYTIQCHNNYSMGSQVDRVLGQVPTQLATELRVYIFVKSSLLKAIRDSEKAEGSSVKSMWCLVKIGPPHFLYNSFVYFNFIYAYTVLK